jgi:5-methylthioadenosine/S-adenosylhomocysteine deaminase
MYFNCKGELKAIKETKVRCVFTRTLLDIKNDGEERINELIGYYKENKDNPLITFTIAPHAFYTCNENYLKRCSEVASEYNLPIHMHYNENRGEVEGTIKEYGKTPLEVLKSTNLINNKLILAHATFVTDEELNAFKDKDISFVHNPLSNLNLGCGIADIKKYKDYVNIALGTDGVGSGNNLNMFYHMSLVDLLQKGKYEDPTVFNSYEVLKMATINGAKALGLEDKIGSIEKGKNADIIMLDLNDISTEPNVDIINNLVHNAFNNVDMTMINGEILLKNKKLCLDINEKELINKIYEIIDRLS